MRSIVPAYIYRRARCALPALRKTSLRQALFYPFTPKRDLIDASSRIYDMNASAPVQNEGRMAEPKSYADS
jgi:hypothetical protein